MRPLNSLTFDSLVRLARTHFNGIPDPAASPGNRFPAPDLLLSALAMFIFQDPSLLQFQRRLLSRQGRSNLDTLFGIQAVPCDSQLRARLDVIPHDQVRGLLPKFFEKMRRAGWGHHFRTSVSGGASTGQYYVMPLDGSDYFHSTQIHCPDCLTGKDKEGVTHYRHVAVAATLVKPKSRFIWPLDAELCAPQDGGEKQDCEINAAKRLLPRIRKEHPQLPLLVTGDDLYAHVPFVKLCGECRMRYILVAKPSSHKELWEWVEDLEKLGETEWVEWSEGPLAKRRYFRGRIARDVPLRADDAARVNFLEVWETNSVGKQVYHNSWVTDLDVPAEQLAEVMWCGRAKWKIENEQFNVQKNGGYHLEHNYGHGEMNLSGVLYYLNVAAFLWHVVLQLGDELWQECWHQVQRRDELWQGLKWQLRFQVWDSWSEMLRAWSQEVGEGSP
jgi:hypothetical protein